MSITITVSGDTIADCYRKIGIGMASAAANEELVEELRKRLRPQGLVVNIDPAEEPPDVEAETEAVAEAVAEAIPSTPHASDRPKRGRPKKAAEPETELAAEITEPGPTVTRDEVITALNAFAAARGGQLAARQAMQETCGVAKLVDVKPEDYGKLLARLRA